MKKLIFFAALFITSYNLYAQPPAAWRLTSFGLERYDNTNAAFMPADSAVYYYSANHTGEPSFEWLEEILRSYTYRPVLYNINPELEYDSVRTYRGNSQGSYSDANVVYAQTLNGDLITNRTRLSSGNVTAQETYTYNSSNLLTESIAQSYKTQYHYDSNNMPDTVWKSVYNSATQQYDPLYTDNFTYNGNQVKKMTRKYNSGNEQYAYDYLYNSNGLMETIIILYSVGVMPAIDTYAIYRYTYAANGDLTIEQHEQTNSPGIGGNMENYEYYAHTYDNDHRRLKDVTYHWNKANQTHDVFSMSAYTYTPEGLPETFESLQWDDANNSWIPVQDTNDARTSHRMRLHYEITWPVGIANQTLNPATIQLYPNPAGEVLTFRISMQDAQPFTASITDMQGRVMMQWNETATRQYTRTIPTAALPPGSYILLVKGEGWKESKLFSKR